MPTPPPRKRFQIHLSTAIVMMFVAGGILWANLTSRLDKTFNVERAHFDGSFEDFKRHMQKGYHDWSIDPDTANFIESNGWPFTFFTITKSYIAANNDPNYDQIVEQRTRSYSAACVDMFIAFAIIFVSWFLCEYLIRRRAARKGA